VTALCWHTEGISVAGSAKRTHNAALCYLALGKSFWRIFLFCALGQLFTFFHLSFKKQYHFQMKKIMCCTLVGYKKYDKKTACNTTRAAAGLAFVRLLLP